MTTKHRPTESCQHENATAGTSFWFCSDCHQVVEPKDVRDAKTRAKENSEAILLAYRHVQKLTPEKREAFLWKLWLGSGSGLRVADRIFAALAE